MNQQRHKLRLFMDARYTRTDFHDGISRFGASLIQASLDLADVTMIIHDEAQLDLLPAGVPWVKASAPTSAQEPWVARQLNQHHPDVVFSPMQTMGSWGRNYGLILTLHDLIYYQHRTPPRNLSVPIRALWWAYHGAYWPQRMLLNRADAVATVSGTTQRLMREHRLTRRRIEVISNAPQPVESPRNPHEKPERSLVYMGSFMDYKNVETLIHGLAYLPEYNLHLLSRITDRRRSELMQVAQVHQVDPRQIIFHNGTDDAEYRRLLRQCTALVSLSRAEGYGLPVAEAMAEGTPVILTDMEIFREIGGDSDDAARWVPVNDHQEDTAARMLAQRVTELEEPGAFTAASKAAREQADRFSWQKSAQRLVALAQTVADQRARSPRV